MTQRREPLKYARRFQDLIVYQTARQLARDVYNITKRLPAGEAFSLTDQWRRASRSVGGQIAEAWAKRRYVRHFVSKLTDADAEQQETQHWIITALDCEYISREEARSLGSLCQEIGRMLNQMIENAEAFCRNQSSVVREESIYVAEPPSDY
jgi:four helix bundle protein